MFKCIVVFFVTWKMNLLILWSKFAKKFIYLYFLNFKCCCLFDFGCVKIICIHLFMNIELFLWHGFGKAKLTSLLKFERERLQWAHMSLNTENLTFSADCSFFFSIFASFIHSTDLFFKLPKVAKSNNLTTGILLLF